MIFIKGSIERSEVVRFSSSNARFKGVWPCSEGEGPGGAREYSSFQPKAGCMVLTLLGFPTGELAPEATEEVKFFEQREVLLFSHERSSV